MILTIDFPPQVSDRLEAFARQEGIDQKAAVEKIVAEHLPQTGTTRTSTGGENAPGPTLAELLGDLLGGTAGSGANNSDDTGQKFAAHLTEKHQEGRL